MLAWIRRLLVGSVLLVIVCSLQGGTAAAAELDVTLIDTIEGRATDYTRQGAAVGTGPVVDGEPNHGWIFTPSRGFEIFQTPAGHSVSPSAISESGNYVVGSYRFTTVPSDGDYPFIWSRSNGFTIMPFEGAAWDVNDAGVMVGDQSFRDRDFQRTGFVRSSNGGLTLLSAIEAGTYPNVSRALKITNSGLVLADGALTSLTGFVPLLWSSSGGLRPVDLGCSLPSCGIEKMEGLTQNGIVYGTYTQHLDTWAGYYTENGGWKDVAWVGDTSGGVFKGDARHMHENGTMVGSIGDLRTNAAGFFWTAATGVRLVGGMTDINGVNSAGVMAGLKGSIYSGLPALWSPALGLVELDDTPGHASWISDNGYVFGSDGGLTVSIWRIGQVPSQPPGPGKGFVDTVGHTFENAIKWLADEGITAGCNPPVNDRFCPNERVTRGQMAAFLVRAMGYSASTADFFVDDDSSVFENAINRLRAAGVTEGCNPPRNNRFCPTDHVTRGQMAAFLVRAFKYSDAGRGNFFVDDNGNVFESAINRLRVAGVTLGCNPPVNNRYCPNDYVTRGQMAAFLKRALE